MALNIKVNIYSNIEGINNSKLILVNAKRSKYMSFNRGCTLQVRYVIVYVSSGNKYKRFFFKGSSKFFFKREKTRTELKKDLGLRKKCMYY